SIAATVAIAVPQIPMKWMRLLNSALLDHDPRPAVRDDATTHAQWDRQRRTRRVSGRKADDDGAGKVFEQIGHDRARRRIAPGLLASRQLADDDGCGPRKQRGLSKLRDHPIEPVRTLTDFLEKEHMPGR